VLVRDALIGLRKRRPLTQLTITGTSWIFSVNGVHQTTWAALVRDRRWRQQPIEILDPMAFVS